MIGQGWFQVKNANGKEVFANLSNVVSLEASDDEKETVLRMSDGSNLRASRPVKEFLEKLGLKTG